MIADPFSTHTFCYEFNIEDIEGTEELPILVLLTGETVSMLRLWVRKGSIGVKPIHLSLKTSERECYKGGDP